LLGGQHLTLGAARRLLRVRLFAPVHSQYNRCCVLQLPQWPPSSFRWRCYLWLRRHITSDLRRRPALRLDRWPTFRLGSVWCPSARPAANLRLASTVPHFRSTFGDPSSLRLTILFHRACAQQSRSIRLAPYGPSSGQADNLLPIRIGCRSLAQLAASSGLRLMLPLLPRLAPASGLLRLLSPYGFTGRRPRGLRLATASPVEPAMQSLFPPNLASTTEPSMSIPFPPVFASSGIIQLNNFRLASAFASSGASSDPSAACASGFTLCPD